MSPRAITGLSVVVPLYRDEDTIELLVADAHAALDPLSLPYEILLVDDGSPDQSGARAEAVAARDSRVRVFHHERNSGLGAALSTGIRRARHSHVLYTDGDHAYPFVQTASFVAALARSDLAIGVRDPRRRPAARRLVTVLWSALVRSWFALPYRDVNCSFKLFPASILDDQALTSRHGFADAELLLRARAKGWIVTELPADLVARRGRPSNFLSLRLIVATLAEARAARLATVPRDPHRRHARVR